MTFHAKNTPLSSTPTPTPSDRSCVATVTTTVASMTTLDIFGCRARSRSEPQEKVLIDTMIMIATSAATGTCATHGRSGTMTTSRNTPATIVESRPVPP